VQIGDAKAAIRKAGKVGQAPALGLEIICADAIQHQHDEFVGHKSMILWMRLSANDVGRVRAALK
jgi:hypothetical protein